MSAADRIAEASKVRRFKMVSEDGWHGMTVRPDGGYVSHKDYAALTDLADAQAQENARLRAENERLRKMLQPEWFYPFDGCDGETTYDNIPELLDEHYFWDRPKIGQHVVKVEAVTTLPSIWAAVRFNCTCPDPDDCECDNDMIVTEHASEAEARAALGDAP